MLSYLQDISWASGDIGTKFCMDITFRQDLSSWLGFGDLDSIFRNTRLAYIVGSFTKPRMCTFLPNPVFKHGANNDSSTHQVTKPCMQ